MSDHLIKVLRAMGSPYTTAAATRIEALEAALREIRDCLWLADTPYPKDTVMSAIAAAALAPEASQES